MTSTTAIVAIVGIISLATSAIVAMYLGKKFHGTASARGLDISLDTESATPSAEQLPEPSAERAAAPQDSDLGK